MQQVHCVSCYDTIVGIATLLCAPVAQGYDIGGQHGSVQRQWKIQWVLYGGLSQ